MPETKVYGPYRRKGGRQIVIVFEDNCPRTVSYPKYLMERHLGRKLDPDLETIDHWDGNFDNNDLSNLRIVPRQEHSRQDTKRVINLKLKCDWCKTDFERSPRLVRDKSKKGNRGLFCSKKCSGKHNRAVQLGLAEPLPVQPFPVSEYYKAKYVEAVIDLGDRWMTKYA